MSGPIFTKQHMEALAALVKAHQPDSIGLAMALASVLAKDNPRFNRALFFKQCGLNKTSIPLVDGDNYL